MFYVKHLTHAQFFFAMQPIELISKLAVLHRLFSNAATCVIQPFSVGP